MDIPVGKYILRSDSQCYWIEEQKVGKKTGKDTQVRITGYYAKIEDLMVSFIERRVRNSDKDDMEAVLKEISKALTDAKKIIREYAKERNK